MIEWNPALAVHIPVIDEQHRLLAERANLLLHALSTSSPELITNTFGYFEAFIQDHFRTEEELLVKSGKIDSPYAQKHMAAHETFLCEFRTFRESLSSPDMNPAQVDAFSRWILAWYQAHIEHDDIGLGEFLRSPE